MNIQENPNRYLVPGLVRGIEVLRLFSADRPSITTSEMAKDLGIPRSSLFRIVQTLEYLKLLVRDNGGTAYRLGVGLLGLGFDYIASLDITDVGRTELEGLRDDTGCSAHMVVRHGSDVIVVMKIPGRSAFTGSLNVGTRLPAHGTVLGRVMLADLTDQEVRDLYGDGELPGYTPQTPRGIDDLLALLRQDRARGYAISNAFFERGISSVAAPVRDHTGRVVAAINVTIPGETKVDAAIVGAVRGRAEAISRALNHRPAAATGNSA